MNLSPHHTRLCIHPRAYEHNIRYFTANTPPGVMICAVVKADGYGHGLKIIAPAAVRGGAHYLGVADNWEAELIRFLEIWLPIIRLRPALLEEAEAAADWELEEIAGTLESAQELSRLGERRGKPIPVHLKIDVGIGRMGFSLPRQLERIQEACRLAGIRVKGVMTHLPCADEKDLELTRSQLQRFEQEAGALDSILPPDVFWHAANSAACLRLPSSRHGMVRVGIAAYGLKPSPEVALPPELKPVMSWKTKVVLVRDMPKGSTVGYGMTHRLNRDARIATLPIGYANGFLRAFSNNAETLIRGKRCPVVGRISMNMTTVDVSDLPEAAAGDEAVLLGEQGEDRICAEELAKRA
ncbi:MAG: alanine racemase, partial [Candidatus Omnitrophota bacterium]